MGIMAAEPSAAHFLILADEKGKPQKLVDILGAAGTADVITIGSRSPLQKAPSCVVVDADLGSAETVQNLRPFMRVATARNIPRLFLTDVGDHQADVQALALDATHVLQRPARAEDLLRHARADAAADFRRLLDDPQNRGLGPGLISATGVLDKIFEGIPKGETLTPSDVMAAEENVIDAVQERGFTPWLDCVRRHHSTSYQHSLLVTGAAASFGAFLKMSRADQRRLAQSSLVHDVGKAMLPLEILDKPGKLDGPEQAIVKKHPRLGYDLLSKAGHFPAETLDVVLHHHELIDGSGYPDGLKGAEIADLVRIVTICDIYSALVEERAYKPAYSSERAIEMMLDMGPKLDRSLLSAFAHMVRRS